MSTEKVLSFFKEITKVPRESGHEEKMQAFLHKFAADRKLECKTDDVGNVLITAPASKGMEKTPTIVLQAHQDMVCEKNAGVKHDFSKDPINYVIEDGWMVAKDTTLGADCGIGVAAALTVLDSKEIRHGKIEALFTTSEETTLGGASGIQPGFFTGGILLNLDSEDEGQIFVGSAGGLDTMAEFTFKFKKLPTGYVAAKFYINGCIGGHSGDDINKDRANPVQLIARFAYKAMAKGAELCFIEGGNRHNALAREAFVILAFPQDKEDKVVKIFNATIADIRNEYKITDPGINGFAEPTEWKKSAVDSVNSAMDFTAQKVECCFRLAGAKVVHSDGYVGWEPKPDSRILKVAVESYRKLFKTDPQFLTIHAGLECGLFTEKYPGIDMISFGPTLRGVHAPGERLELATLDKFWDLLVEMLQHA
ncbi:MAG: M20/M25/M40 family metallo-hydrolase [Bacteroidales bacterium]